MHHASRLLILLLGCAAPSANALDPFYTEEQMKEMIAAYKARKPATPQRPTRGFPLALKLETIRIPELKLNSASLLEALREVRDQARKADERNGDVEFVLSLDAADRPNPISLDLKDLSLIEALKYITELAGCGFQVKHEQIFVSAAPEARKQWRALAPKCFSLSQALATKWFPDAVAVKTGDVDTLCRAEAVLEKLGIPCPIDATADFVPSFNVLAVVASPVASDCLETLIQESECELRVRQVKSGESTLPEGMSLVSFSVSKNRPEVFRHILHYKDGLVHPESCSTNQALLQLGAVFPQYSAAWLDQKSQTLHVINTAPNIEAIKALISPP